MPAVSNADLMQAINSVAEIQGRTLERLSAVEGQVKITNGKVANLMEDKIRRDEREKVLASPPSQSQTIQYAEKVVVQPKWFQNEKLVAAAITLIVALSALIQYLGQRAAR